MKLFILLGIIFVAEVSARYDDQDSYEFLRNISTMKPRVEVEPNFGRPLPFIMIDSTNHSISFDFDKITEIFSHPEVADRKIVAVSIVGALKKEQSYMMIYCLKYLYAHYKSVNYMENPLNRTDWIDIDDPIKGFVLEDGSDCHTTGIFMWSDIFLHEQIVDGKTEKLAIVLLDTQGLFDSQTSPTDNAKIFALGSLLSSLQIFNLKSVIEESQLEYLQAAAEFAWENANISSNDANNNKPFQNLLFVIRDWNITEEKGYGEIGGDKYIRQVLSSSNYQKPAVKQVGDFICSSFDNVRSYLLPHSEPGYDGRISVMDAYFGHLLLELIDRLFLPKNLVKKRFSGNEVNGFEYGELMKTFVDKFQPPQVYESIPVDNPIPNLLAAAMKYFMTLLYAIDDNTQVDLPEYLEKSYEEAAKATVLKVKNLKKIGANQDEEKFIERLKNEMKQFYIAWKKITFEVTTKIVDTE